MEIKVFLEKIRKSTQGEFLLNYSNRVRAFNGFLDELNVLNNELTNFIKQLDEKLLYSEYEDSILLDHIIFNMIDIEKCEDSECADVRVAVSQMYSVLSEEFNLDLSSCWKVIKLEQKYRFSNIESNNYDTVFYDIEKCVEEIFESKTIDANWLVRYIETFYSPLYKGDKYEKYKYYMDKSDKNEIFKNLRCACIYTALTCKEHYFNEYKSIVDDMVNTLKAQLELEEIDIYTEIFKELGTSEVEDWERYLYNNNKHDIGHFVHRVYKETFGPRNTGCYVSEDEKIEASDFVPF